MVMSRSTTPLSVRALLVVLSGVLLLSACNPDNLFSPKGVAGQWLEDVEEVEVEDEADGVVSTDLRTAASAEWPNDALALLSDVTPQEAADIIWGASEQEDRFVQVAREDIAHALPEIQFPEFLPTSVRYISTQLVFLPRTGGLSNSPTAAFGLWTVEPYSLSRSVGQKATIFVHNIGEELSFEGDITQGCGQFQDRVLSECEPITLGGNVAWWLTSLDGNILVWYSGSFRYEMTVRAPVTRSVAEQVAVSSVPLVNLLPFDTGV